MTVIGTTLAIRLLCEYKLLNISNAHLWPEFAFGGSCLPKDLGTPLYLANSRDVGTPILTALQPGNQVHIEYAASMIRERGERFVGVIGLSFKWGTDDRRECPLVESDECQIGNIIDIKIHGPETNMSQQIDANERYVAEVVPRFGMLLCERTEEAMQASVSVAGILADQGITTDQYAQLFSDLVGVRAQAGPHCEYRGICW